MGEAEGSKPTGRDWLTPSPSRPQAGRGSQMTALVSYDTPTRHRHRRWAQEAESKISRDLVRRRSVAGDVTGKGRLCSARVTRRVTRWRRGLVTCSLGSSSQLGSGGGGGQLPRAEQSNGGWVGGGMGSASQLLPLPPPRPACSPGPVGVAVECASVRLCDCASCRVSGGCIGVRRSAQGETRRGCVSLGVPDSPPTAAFPHGLQGSPPGTILPISPINVGNHSSSVAARAGALGT